MATYCLNPCNASMSKVVDSHSTHGKTLERQETLSKAFIASQQHYHPENCVVRPPFKPCSCRLFMILYNVPSLLLTSWLPPSAAPSSCSPCNVRHSHFHLYTCQESKVSNEQKLHFLKSYILSLNKQSNMLTTKPLSFRIPPTWFGSEKARQWAEVGFAVKKLDKP